MGANDIVDNFGIE